MKIKNQFLFIVISVVYFYSCAMDYSNSDLSIVNKTNKQISILYSNDVLPELQENEVAFYIADRNVVMPDSSLIIFNNGNKNAWHDYIQKSEKKRLYFYVFDTDTLRKYNHIWTLRDLVIHQKFLRTISYNEDELKRINWKVIINQ